MRGGGLEGVAMMGKGAGSGGGGGVWRGGSGAGVGPDKSEELVSGEG